MYQNENNKKNLFLALISIFLLYLLFLLSISNVSAEVNDSGRNGVVGNISTKSNIVTNTNTINYEMAYFDKSVGGECLKE